MLMHVMSDLHLEFDNDFGVKFIESLDPSNVDVLILAGDIFVSSPRLEKHRIRIFNSFCDKYKHVFYVPGNHDYFGSSPDEMHSLTNSLGLVNFEMLLPGDKSTINGKVFRGGTLWYPDPALNDYYFNFIKKGWPDFNHINNFEPWVYEQNQEFRERVSEKIQEGDVIISHMLPLQESIHPRYVNADTNCFFKSDESKYIKKNKPALWIHGHTHYPFDYKYEDTRMYCNPRAYPNEYTNDDFYNRILIEI